MAVQFVSLDEFSHAVKDGDRLVLGGFIGAVVPEALEKAIGSRFRSEGHPRDLSLYFAAGQGDSAERAVNNLAEEGLVSFAIGGHWGLFLSCKSWLMKEKLPATTCRRALSPT